MFTTVLIMIGLQLTPVSTTPTTPPPQTPDPGHYRIETYPHNLPAADLQNQLNAMTRLRRCTLQGPIHTGDHRHDGETHMLFLCP